ncbi:MAG: hypothetical protein RMN51_01345 [Verrucomicrobiota bacterium]|nr:hypothetical protein [Verrucomicrobiota bacterium]
MTEVQQMRRIGCVRAIMLLVAAAWMAMWLHLAYCRDAGPYLRPYEGLSWWTVPRPAAAELQQRGVACSFRAEWVVSAPIEPSWLRMAVFRSGAATLNGIRVEGLTLNGHRWKRPQTVEITGLLRPGTNELWVHVTNASGPPALWVKLQIGACERIEPLRWQVATAAGEFREAHLASKPLPMGPYLRAFRTLADLVASEWPGVAAVVAAVVTAGATGYRLRVRWIHHIPTNLRLWLSSPGSDGWLLGTIGMAWVLLFANNLPQLPRIYGFDAEGHEAYVRYIQEQGRIPLAHEGWQMYQPPLYYLMAAAVLEFAGLTTSDEAAVMLLRALNGLVGWAHSVAVFWLLRLLYPFERWKARVGLLLTSALGAHVMIAHYVTNETMAGLWVTLALGLMLRSRKEEHNLKWAGAAGGALGLAMLTKFSTVLAVPIVLAVCCLPCGTASGQASRATPYRRPFRALGTAVAVFLLICGWHYARVWWHFGQPFVGNWDGAIQSAWWQEPGYRTPAEYLRLGMAWSHPWYSSFCSFWDGLYATLWGDGLVSGVSWMVFRPPWNEPWMAATWWLSIVWTLIILFGAGVLTWRVWCGTVEPAWWASGLLGFYLWGLLYMSVRVGSYAQVKAFYALPALSGLAVALVVGWERLTARTRWGHWALGTLLVLWWILSFGAFWVSRDHPQTAVVQALWALDQGRIAEGQRWFQQALLRHPTYPELRAALAESVRTRPREPGLRDLYATSLEAHQLWSEALEHRQLAVALDPSQPEWLNNLAWSLATVPEPTLQRPLEAVTFAQRACELSQWTNPVFIGTLAAALAAAGDYPMAVQRAEQAIELARQQGKVEIANRNQVLVEQYRRALPARP